MSVMLGAAKAKGLTKMNPAQDHVVREHPDPLRRVMVTDE